MASSTYRSTPQTTNAARVSRVVMGPCADLYRDVIRHYIPQKDLHTELQKHRSTVKSLVKGTQRDVLYPKTGVCTAKYEEFDISLLYLLIRNMCGIPAHGNGWGTSPAPNDRSISANLDRIREIRNKYCGHSPLICLSHADFGKIWTDVRQIVQEIEFILFGPSTKFTKEIDILRFETMDPEQEQHYLDIIDKQKETLDNIVEEQEKQGLMLGKQEKIMYEQDEHLSKLEKTQSQQDEHVTKLEKAQFQLDEHLTKLEKTQSQQDEHLTKLEKTQSQQDEHLTKLEKAQSQQNEHLTRLGKAHSQQDKHLTKLEKTQSQQDEHLTKLEKVQSQQDEHLTKLEKAQSHQDEHLTNLEKAQSQQGEHLIKVERVQSHQEAHLQSLESSVTNLKKKYRNTSGKKSEQIDPEAENILVNTEKVLQNHASSPTYTKTNAVDTVIEHLKKHHIVILTGKSGEGKTTTSLQTMYTLYHEYSFVAAIIEEPNEWNKVVHADKNMVVLLDDIVGRTNLDTYKMENWRNKFSNVLSSATEGNVYVIIGIRDNILKEIKENYPGEKLFSEEYELNLSSDNLKLTLKEKIVMMYKYEISCKYKSSNEDNETSDYYVRYDDNKDDYIYSYRAYDIFTYDAIFGFPYGFPHICYLFFTKKEFFELGTEFFKQPSKEMFQNVDKMRKSSTYLQKVGYCVLVYVSIHQKINTDSSFVDCVNFEEIAKTVRLSNYQDQDIKDAVKELQGSYLITDENECVFIFIHETVRETVLLSFGQLSPETVIQHCSKSTPSELIRTEGYKKKPEEIVLRIPKKYYPVLVEKFFSDGCFCSVSFLSHPATNDADFAAVVFTSHPGQKRMDIYESIICSITHWNKPQLINAMLKYACTDSDRVRFMCTLYFMQSISQNQTIGITSAFIFRTHNNENHGNRNQFMLSKFDILYLLHGSIYFGKRENVLTLCRFISGLGNGIEYYTHNIRDHEGHDTGFTALHYCVAQDWDDVADCILICHIPTKGDENWTCLHLAAFCGRLSMLKKFENKGLCLAERTNEGYSVLQTFMLGLRYNKANKSSYLDVNEKNRTSVTSNSFTSEENLKDILLYLLSSELTCIADFGMPLDRQGNLILHYLVIHNYEMIFDIVLQKIPDIINHRNDTELPTALHVALFLGRYDMVKKLWDILMHSKPDGTCCMKKKHETNEYSLIHALMLGLRYETKQCDRYINVNEDVRLVKQTTSSDDKQYIETLRYIFSQQPHLIDDAKMPLNQYGNNIIHYIVIHDREMMFDSFLELIPDAFSHRNNTHLPTALHFAAFLGRHKLMKKLCELETNSNRDRNCMLNNPVGKNEYSLLHALTLGLRYNSGPNFRCIDVDATIELKGNISTKEKSYLETLKFLLVVQKSPTKDLSSPIDVYGNNIIYYLIIHERMTVFDMLVKENNSLVYHRSNTELPTTLHLAVYLGRHEFVTKLWDAGVRPVLEDMPLTLTLKEGRLCCGCTMTRHCFEDCDDYYSDEPLTFVRDEWLGKFGLNDFKLKIVPYVDVYWGTHYDFDITEDILKKLK